MNRMLTRFGKDLDPDNVLSEYPRPQLKRESYLNLNGHWDFAVSKQTMVETFNKKILVPFSPESVLSGVDHILLPDEYAFYHRTVTFEPGFVRDVTILHFGAVDQTCDIWVNGKHRLTHVGGFTPFQLDITEDITSQSIDLLVRVKDVTDTSYHLTGKQRLKRGGIWYTPQSGIWQTVWIESLPKVHLKDLEIIPHYDESAVEFRFGVSGKSEIEVTIMEQDKIVHEAVFQGDRHLVSLESFVPWTPENPFLYDVRIKVKNDLVTSYFGMRKFSKAPDSKGIMRFHLNNRPYFLTGVLDQGYFSDGLLTPPSDEAMIHDIRLMKDMGFNLLRKHIKIEPLRWYWHCDRMGMIVWQDMINGSERKDIVFHGALAILGIHIRDSMYRLFGRKNTDGRALYEQDLWAMMDHLKNVTSLSTWVPFNEAWGQFDAARINDMVKKTDSTRLVDHASGWSDQKAGDYHSRHIYFTKVRFRKRHAKKRVLALTEFGGYSLATKGHVHDDEKVFGYKTFENTKRLLEAIKGLYETQIAPSIDKGLNVLVYTQLSDVEDEVNGVVTYDREVVKVEPEKMAGINRTMIRRFQELTMDDQRD